MNIWNRGYSCVFLLFMIFSTNTIASSQTEYTLYAPYMEAAAKMWQFNGYVLIARDGKGIFSRGYGMANFEEDLPNKANTRFRLASITKTFTAVAVMMLAERGKLGLGDPACKYLPDCPPSWKHIVVRNLLNHTSGIPDYAAVPDFMRRIAVATTPDELISNLKSRSLDFETGTRFAYSNSNYIVLGKIIEQVSGRLYSAFVQENILRPAGMNDTGYDDNLELIRHRALGYRAGPRGIVSARYMDMSNAYAAGGMYSTAEDLLRWDQALARDKLLSAKSLEEIFTPGKGDAGYGWFVHKAGGRLRQMQSGVNSGFAAAIYRYPKEKVFIALLTNVEDNASHLARIAHDLEAITFGEQFQVPSENVEAVVDVKLLPRYAGEYEFGPGRRLTIIFEANKLFSKRGEEPAFEMFSEGPTRFFLKIADVHFEFLIDSKGKVSGMTMRANGQEFRGTKIK